jgi:hypothetical protein
MFLTVNVFVGHYFCRLVTGRGNVLCRKRVSASWFYAEGESPPVGSICGRRVSVGRFYSILKVSLSGRFYAEGESPRLVLHVIRQESLYRLVLRSRRVSASWFCVEEESLSAYSTWRESLSVGWFYEVRESLSVGSTRHKSLSLWQESLSVDSKWRGSFFQFLLHGRRVSAGWYYAAGESLPVGSV